MATNKQAFLNHLAQSRRVVEQWPQWKQDVLKAAPESSVVSALVSPPPVRKEIR